MKSIPFLRRYHFRVPALWLWLLTAAIVLVFLRLSLWQYHRYQSKLVWQQALHDNSQVLTLAQIDVSKPASWRYLPLQLEGRYLPHRDLLLDNQTYRGQVGYHVLSLFLPKGQKQVLVVDRGWVKAAKFRQVLPVLPTMEPQTRLQGRLKPMTSAFHLHENKTETTNWPIRIQVIDAAALERITGHKVFPFVLLLNAHEQNGFVRDWQLGGLTATRHFGYAVQWIMLAITLCVTFIAVNWRRVEKGDEGGGVSS